jgi:hypothetical protein
MNSRFQQPLSVFKAESRKKTAVPGAPKCFLTLARSATVADAVHMMVVNKVQ